ncbi:methyltransferase [Sphingomonas sp. LB-2]|uniref:class I SAM-dependent methyltransferase n=1 Tax=Sphingomonas caeni TaxID=2984949 RepID=UPI002232C2C1|nr:methyltransferase [Sphingomonas caeni]MCW3846154.1 methyltransferase [Sphingomonas caeni]
MRHWIKAALIGAAMCVTTTPALAQKAADYAAAVSAPGRPDDQIKLDAGRKPAAVLQFLGLRRGMTAADVMAGAGYYSEIMARIVGPKGKVIAFEPSQFYENDKAKALWAALTGRAPNVSLTPYPWDQFAAAPNSLDFTLLHLVYHDLYWESAQYKVPRMDPSGFVRTLFAATKPGGIVGVIDHVALPGDARATVEKYHRIDPAVVKADFTAAGFVLEAESQVLRMADDDHSKGVFDPAIRGRTDRFVYRFRKPRR